MVVVKRSAEAQGGKSALGLGVLTGSIPVDVLNGMG
jgi:hypothetical protein